MRGKAQFQAWFQSPMRLLGRMGLWKASKIRHWADCGLIDEENGAIVQPRTFFRLFRKRMRRVYDAKAYSHAAVNNLGEKSQVTKSYTIETAS